MEVISAAERMYLKISAQTKLNKKKALKTRSKMEATKWRADRSQETTQSSSPPIWTKDDTNSRSVYSIIHLGNSNSFIAPVTGKAVYYKMKMHS